MTSESNKYAVWIDITATIFCVLLFAYSLPSTMEGLVMPITKASIPILPECLTPSKQSIDFYTPIVIIVLCVFIAISQRYLNEKWAERTNIGLTTAIASILLFLFYFNYVSDFKNNIAPRLCLSGTNWQSHLYAGIALITPAMGALFKITDTVNKFKTVYSNNNQ